MSTLFLNLAAHLLVADTASDHCLLSESPPFLWLNCPPKLRAVPFICHWRAGFLTGLVYLISQSRKVKEAALETWREECKSSEPVIGASSSQPA